MQPVSVHYKSDEKVIAVTWPDEHISTFPTSYLRGWCPCALCQGHFRSRYEFVEHEGAALEVENAEPVGGYGLKFTWGDGHDAGIYTFRELRAICPCEACDGERIVARVDRGKQS